MTRDTINTSLKVYLIILDLKNDYLGVDFTFVFSFFLCYFSVIAKMNLTGNVKCESFWENSKWFAN